MIQHHAACFVLNKPWHRQQQNDSVTDMLTHLKWPILEDRRKVSRLILFFKIVRKLFIVPDHCLPASAPLESTRSHHSLKFFAHIQSRIDIYKYSFLPRSITVWNNLDIQDIDKINLATFKDHLSVILIILACYPWWVFDNNNNTAL